MNWILHLLLKWHCQRVADLELPDRKGLLVLVVTDDVLRSEAAIRGLQQQVTPLREKGYFKDALVLNEGCRAFLL